MTVIEKKTVLGIQEQTCFRVSFIKSFSYKIIKTIFSNKKEFNYVFD